MRIVFICGCLEPGKDGVGDYVRQLSAEIIRQGHYAGAIAFRDKLIEHSIDSLQHTNEIDIPVLRIPDTTATNQRLNIVKSWITKFNPEWISLQYVPYSFHQKGIPLSLYKELLYVGKPYRWHIMFHELWIGKKGFNIKRAIYSWLQRHSVVNLIEFIHPQNTHTHLPEYFNQLKKLNVAINLLPLFSNIKVCTHADKILESGVFRVGFFSQSQTDEPIITFLEQLKRILSERDIKLQILFIGGKNGKANIAATELNHHSTLGDQISFTGFLEDEALSKAMQSCNLGITSVYRHGLGKSGSVAAFIAHGIPVAAPRIHLGYQPTDIGFSSIQMRSSIVLEADMEKIEQAGKSAAMAAQQIDVAHIAKAFLSDLEISVSGN